MLKRKEESILTLKRIELILYEEDKQMTVKYKETRINVRRMIRKVLQAHYKENKSFK